MINVLVCDDDPKILKQVQTILNNIKKKNKLDFDVDLKLNGDFTLSSRVVYDIAIVDIEMPGISGLRLAEKLKQYNPDIIIIILTSFSAYLDSAMKISVFRYLSKPIDTSRFVRNFGEALHYYKQLSQRIYIEKDDEVNTIKTKDILYIENLKHGSTIVTKYDTYRTNKKPQEWLETINQPNCFVLSHKSFIVNLQNVINFDKSTVTFNGLKGLIEVNCVSQRKYSDFKKAFYSFVGGI